MVFIAIMQDSSSLWLLGGWTSNTGTVMFIRIIRNVCRLWSLGVRRLGRHVVLKPVRTFKGHTESVTCLEVLQNNEGTSTPHACVRAIYLFCA